MTIKSADMPAMPMLDINAKPGFAIDKSSGFEIVTDVLTKREMFCLHMGVAETGDAELDAIIRNGNRQKIAAQICNGFICGDFDLAGSRYRFTDLVSESVSTADALLAELERTK